MASNKETKMRALRHVMVMERGEDLNLSITWYQSDNCPYNLSNSSAVFEVRSNITGTVLFELRSPKDIEIGLVPGYIWLHMSKDKTKQLDFLSGWGRLLIKKPPVAGYAHITLLQGPVYLSHNAVKRSYKLMERCEAQKISVCTDAEQSSLVIVGNPSNLEYQS